MEPEIKNSKFVDVMEIVYAILMAAGLTAGWELFIKDFHDILMALKKMNFEPVILCILFAISCTFVLIRFFFVPYKNILPLVNKNKGYLKILSFDVPIMLTHSAVFYLLCLEFHRLVLNNQYFPFVILFMLLLAINTCWLFSIKWRGADSLKSHSRWKRNNLAHFVALSLVCLFLTYYSPKNLYFHTSFWYSALFVLITLSNSLWDFILTAPDYFE